MKTIEFLIFLIFISFIAGVYLHFGAFTDSWGFGDETYYYLSAKSIVENNGVISHIPKLYSTGGYEGEALGKPPLSYYIPAFFYWIGGGNLTIFKFFSPLFGILTIILIFYLGKELYNFWAGLIAAILTAGTSLFISFSLMSYVETLTAFGILLTFYCIYKAITLRTNKWIIFSGIVFGLFMKEIYFFIPIALGFYLVLKYFTHSFDKKEFKILFLIIVIGLVIYAPWMIRNYLNFKNPIFPYLPEIFGYGGLDEIGYKLRVEEGSTDIMKTFNLNILVTYFGALFYLGIFGVLYLIYRKRLLLLSFILILSLPIFLTSLRDVRYLFSIIPLMSLAVSLFIIELFYSQGEYRKYYKYLSLFVILIIFPFSLYNLILQSMGIDTTIRRMAPGLEETYDWVDKNMPEDVVFLDLWTPNFVYSTNRVGTFTHIVNGGDLWKFWELPEIKSLEILKRHGVTHICVYKLFFFYTEEQLGIWTHIPREFISIADNWKSLEVIYDQEYVMIYRVNYGE